MYWEGFLKPAIGKIILTAMFVFYLFLSPISATTPCTSSYLLAADYNFTSDFSVENIEYLTIPIISEIRFNISDKYNNSTLSITIDKTIFYQTPVSKLYHPYHPEYVKSPYYSIPGREFNQELFNLSKGLEIFNNSKLKINLGNDQVGEISLQYKPGFCPPIGKADYSSLILVILVIVIVLLMIYLFRKQIYRKK